MADNVYAPLPTDTTSPLSDDAHQALFGMGPWQRLISVVTALMAVLMCCGAGSMLTLGAATSAAADAGLGAMSLPLALLYLFMAALYLAPAAFLWRSASAIVLLKETGAAEHATAALVAQRSFWRFVGIAFLVIMGLYALILVGVMVMAVVGAANA